MGMSGNIQTVPLVDLLQWITSDNRTGVLILKREEHERRVYFKKGRVNSFSSSDERDRFGQFLVHCGALTPITLAQVLDEQKKTKHAIGRAVVELGVMTEQEVKQRLKSHATDLCTSLFLWKEGSFEFVSEDVKVDERDFVAFAISVDEILLEAHRRIDEWGRIKTVFARDDMVPKLDPERALKALSELDSNSVEYMLLEHIDGRRNISDLYSGIPASEFVLYEALYRLHADGVISVSDRPVVRDITGEFLLPTKRGAAEEVVEDVVEEELDEEPAPRRAEAPPERPAPPPPPPPKPEPPKVEAKPAPPEPRPKERPASETKPAKDSKPGKDAKAKEQPRDEPKAKPREEPKPKESRPAQPTAQTAPPKKVVVESTPAPAPAPAAGGSKVPLVIGGVVLLAIVGGVAMMMMGKGGEGGPGGTPTPTTTAPTRTVETPTPTVEATQPPATPTAPSTPAGPSPAEQAATLAAQAKKALDGKKLADAEKLATEALGLDPANADAKAVMAKVEEAQTQGKVGAIVAKGKAEERAGRFDAAERIYQEALAEDTNNAMVQQLLRDLKDKKAAEEKLAPVLAELEAALRSEDVKAAEAALSRAEGIARGDARITQARTKLQSLANKAEEGAKKEEAKARYDAAQKAVDAGDAAKAKSELAAAMALDKANPLAAQLQEKIKALESKPVAGKITVGEPIPTSEDFAPLKFRTKAAPTYPEKSLAGKVTGKVLVSVTVGADGSVTDAKLLKQESGDTGFNEASLEAARKWKFDPPVRKDGAAPAASSWSVPIRFEP